MIQGYFISIKVIGWFKPFFLFPLNSGPLGAGDKATNYVSTKETMLKAFIYKKNIDPQ